MAGLFEGDKLSCSYPGRKRHRFDEKRVCKLCGFSENQGQLHLPDVGNVTGTEVKLRHLSELFDAYSKSREELMNFINQQRKAKLEIHCQIEPHAQEQINFLYTELGRETFWSKERIQQ